MTVSSTYAPARFTGDASTTAFSFPYPFFDPTHLAVQIYDSASSSYLVDVTLNGGATYGYTVTGTPDAVTGVYPSAVVTFNNAPKATHTVVLGRATGLTQPSHWTATGPINPPTLETAIDRAFLIAQEVNQAVAHAIRVPAGDAALAQVATAGNRANTVLGFDGVGALALLPNTSVTATDLSNGLVKAMGASALISLAARFKQPFYPTDYGATGDGTTDDSAAFQAAITAAGIVGGKVVVKSTAAGYVVGNLTCGFNNISFEGEATTTAAAHGVTLIALNTTSPIFTFTSVAGIHLRNLYFTSKTQQASGYFVKFDGCNECGMFACQFKGGWDNVHVKNNCTLMWFDKFTARDFKHDGVLIDNGTRGDINWTRVTMDQADASYAPNSGFRITQQGGTFTLMNADLLHCHQPVLVDPGAGQFSNWGQLINVTCDTTDFDIPTKQGVGLSLVPTNGGIVEGWQIVNLWTATGYIGVKAVADATSTLANISFVNHQSRNNLTHGALVTNGVNINWSNPEIIGNSTATTNTSDGLRVTGSGSTSVKVIGGRIGGTAPGFTSQHKNSVYLAADFGGTFTMLGTDVSGYGTKAIEQAGTVGGGSSVMYCPGFNPGGTATQSVGGSPYTYTAGISTETINIYGATTLGVTVDGVTVANASPASFTLPPRKAAIITYTGSPTMAVTKH